MEQLGRLSLEGRQMEPFEAILFEEFERDCDRYCNYLEILEQQAIIACRTHNTGQQYEGMVVEQ